MFNIEREKLIVQAGVRNVFTPYTPIQQMDLFFGRKKEVSNIITQLNTPGQHSVLFGDRGVGKTSLANIAADMLKDLVGGKLYIKRCDSSDTFPSIMEQILSDAGCDINVTSLQKQKAEGGKAGIDFKVLSAGIDTKTTSIEEYDGIRTKANSPSWVADQLKGINALFLLDEIDVIAKEEKWKIAELVKQLSDIGSGLKFLIVGIAETASDLTQGHESVQRCLKETPLRKLSDTEVESIITNGATKLNIEFSLSARKKIITVSAGYAHFTHLLALKASESAIGENRRLIELGHIKEATDDAMGDAEGSLRTKYDSVVRSANTEEFKKILFAASEIKKDEFTASDLREMYSQLFRKSIQQSWLNAYLIKIVSNENETILRRLAKGVYKFNDPRMPSYIRLANINLFPQTDDSLESLI
ncbi:hypothetical protein NT6N_25730 [Oceaniferula spumae]|uniref:AAA+ ATPase domain-containing protein n=1 Tax=Oceaniferula spumae TaxID=2979115 RepID=A0AAT9FNJ4_9BACT